MCLVCLSLCDSGKGDNRLIKRDWGRGARGTSSCGRGG